jgi:Zn ribbon nucleic-acid-binding protein
MRTNVIDLTHKNANMYGVQPCPQCQSRYRAPYRREVFAGEPKVLVIECDECGHTETADNTLNE